MATAGVRTICWKPIWNKEREGVGLEHLLLAEGTADSVVLAFDEEHGPFRLTYRLTWGESWRLRDAELMVATARYTRSLSLQTDGHGHWRDGDGHTIVELDGCMDIDIWPTPFTNTFPIRREPMATGERRAFRMALDLRAGPDVSGAAAGLYAPGRPALSFPKPRRKRLQCATTRGRRWYRGRLSGPVPTDPDARP